MGYVPVLSNQPHCQCMDRQGKACCLIHNRDHASSRSAAQATLRQLYAATEASMGSPLPSPAPSLSSPKASGATPGRFCTPDLDLPRFHLPASSTQRSIERHREEALQVSL